MIETILFIFHVLYEICKRDFLYILIVSTARQRVRKCIYRFLFDVAWFRMDLGKLINKTV